MTIQEAKGILRHEMVDQYEFPLRAEALKVAIRSLEAWETIAKQIKEFEKSQSFVMNDYTNGVRNGCGKAIEYVAYCMDEIEKGGSDG